MPGSYGSWSYNLCGQKASPPQTHCASTVAFVNVSFKKKIYIFGVYLIENTIKGPCFCLFLCPGVLSGQAHVVQ